MPKEKKRGNQSNIVENGEDTKNQVKVKDKKTFVRSTQHITRGWGGGEVRIIVSLLAGTMRIFFRYLNMIKKDLNRRQVKMSFVQGSKK